MAKSSGVVARTPSKKSGPSKKPAKKAAPALAAAKGSVARAGRKAPAPRADSGRRAAPVSMSLMPEERAELEQFTALTGVGATSLYRELVAPKVRAANWALAAMVDAGMEIHADRLPATIWRTSMDAAELDDLYARDGRAEVSGE